jgi:glycosyltransferase involved in cell wall biosynthesis
MTPRVIVIIPAYNEERTVGGVIAGLRQAAPAFDRVIVSDGSQDRTADIVSELGEKQLRLPCNLGYGRALQTGLKYALARNYEIVVCMDADGQHKASDAPRLVQALIESNADMVIGSRYCEHRLYASTITRRIGQVFFSRLTHLLIRQRVYDTTSGFKALRARACQALVTGTFMDFHMETMVRLRLLGLKVVEFPITVGERAFGRSMHSFKSVFHYPLKTLLLTMVAAMDVFLARRVK